MRSTKLITALVCATMFAAPAAYAMPIDPRTTVVTTSGAPDVPPPPSSIAMSAGDEYEALRAPAPQPVADTPSAPAGFDWLSAAIGAAAAAGLALVSLAALGTRRRAVSA
jgi:hypothetical protein